MSDFPSGPKPRRFRGQVLIDWNRCKGCGFCIEFCPPKILAFSDEFNSHGYHPPCLVKEEVCTGCDLCGLYCPDFAIYGVRLPVEPRSESGALDSNSKSQGAIPNSRGSQQGEG